MPQIQRQKTAVLSISLPTALRAQVLRYAKSKDVSVSQFIKQKLESELFMAEFEKVSKPFQAAFKKLGIKTDEDVEKYFG